jgi:TQO small subunit DoxD
MQPALLHLDIYTLVSGRETRMRLWSMTRNGRGTWCMFAFTSTTRHAIDTADTPGAWQHSGHRGQTMGLFSQKLPGLSIGLLRIMFGILWLDAALQKAPWVINSQGARFGWLSNWIWTEMQHPTFDVYKTFLENVVWPHFTFFGYMSFVVEMALGLSLLLGVCTVLSGLGGALWQFNIALGSYSVPGEWYWIWPLLIAPHLVFALSRAGRSVGLDLFLSQWLAQAPTGKTGIGRLLRRWM